MDGKYAVYLGTDQVGDADVKQQGLYLYIRCRCQFRDAGIYKIVVSSGTAEENLGVCIPMEDGFGVNTKIPIKRLGTELLNIRAEPKYSKNREPFILLNPDAPFSGIADLHDAYLCKQNGQLGICIRRNQHSCPQL